MLETAEGGIFESNAIARYVARLAGSGLLGATPVQAVRARARCGRVPRASPPQAAAPALKRAWGLAALARPLRCAAARRRR